MASVLVISSYVARGHIGLGASGFALQRLGHEVTGWPTVLLSNHPGHARHAGLPVHAETLTGMLEVYAAAGWLGGFDAVLTGYLPTAAHAAAAASAIQRIRALRPSLVVCCDPVLGDDTPSDPAGRLYIDPAAAAALRDQVVPLAGIITPNRFELAWLSGRAVTTAHEAVTAARAIGVAQTLVTSVPSPASQIPNLLIADGGVWQTAHERRPAMPHGTGDFFSGLLLGWQLRGASPQQAFECASAGLQIAAEASTGKDELQLAETQDRWANPVVEPAVALATLN
jgi:pyridoxine kinase